MLVQMLTKRYVPFGAYCWAELWDVTKEFNDFFMLMGILHCVERSIKVLQLSVTIENYT